MASELHVRQDVALAPLTTMGVGGSARFFCTAHTEDDLVAAVAWAKASGHRLFVLGGGSNLLVRDAGFDGLVVHIAMRGIKSYAAGELSAGAGEVWDTFVDYAVGAGLAGVECLSGIPGYVGGTPVQNVGAYGQEVAETISLVRAFDRATERFVQLTNAECRFRYRESLFNTDEPGRYVVTRVNFRLRPGGAPTLKYAELQQRFAGQADPPLRDVARVVREIRRSKGMLLVDGDADCRSAGSFFKNPIVSEGMLDQIGAAVGIDTAAVPHWPVSAGRVKVPAAWLLERAGFVKGYGNGPAGISTRHTLALTNRGGASCADVQRLQDEIVQGVRGRFGIELEREPVLVG